MPQFLAPQKDISCLMPKLFIYNDTTHESYMIISEGITIVDVVGKYRRVQPQIECTVNDTGFLKCAALVNSGCGERGKN